MIVACLQQQQQRQQQQQQQQQQENELDVIRTQQVMIQDRDVMFCMSLVDKFRQLDQDQRTFAQVEILEVLHSAQRHATIPGLGVRSTIRSMHAERASRPHTSDSDSEPELVIQNVQSRPDSGSADQS